MDDVGEAHELPEYEYSKDPDLEAELHISVVNGLANADLAPLVKLLRSELEIPEVLRGIVADAIEGMSPACKIVARRKSPGKPVKEGVSAIAKSGLIAAFFESRNAIGEYEAAILECSNQFGLSRSSIAKAIRLAKESRDKLPDALKIAWDRGHQRQLEELLSNERDNQPAEGASTKP